MTTVLRKCRLRLETHVRFAERRLRNGAPPKLVVFLHIPKTAGESVNKFISDCLGSRRSGKFVRINVSKSIHSHLHKVNSPKLAFLSGHFDWEGVEVVSDRDIFLFTFLRRPSDRLISWYLYINAKYNGVPNGDGGLINTETPADFFDREMYERDLNNNLMVRQLSGDMDEVPQADARWRELLEQAKANLGRLDYVGFQETFSYDFAQIVDLIGLPPFKTAPRINVTSDLYKGHSAGQKELEFDATTREKIRELTRWDNELYDYALAAFR